jgi:hypothetical protein
VPGVPFFTFESSVGTADGSRGVSASSSTAATLSSDEALLAWLSSHVGGAESDAATDDSPIGMASSDCDFESLDEMFAELEADLLPMLL